MSESLVNEFLSRANCQSRLGSRLPNLGYSLVVVHYRLPFWSGLFAEVLTRGSQSQVEEVPGILEIGRSDHARPLRVLGFRTRRISYVGQDPGRGRSRNPSIQFQPELSAGLQEQGCPVKIALGIHDLKGFLKLSQTQEN